MIYDICMMYHILIGYVGYDVWHIDRVWYIQVCCINIYVGYDIYRYQYIFRIWYIQGRPHIPMTQWYMQVCCINIHVRVDIYIQIYQYMSATPYIIASYTFYLQTYIDRSVYIYHTVYHCVMGMCGHYIYRSINVYL